MKPADFEKALGSPFDSQNPFYFRDIINVDEKDEFPELRVRQALLLGANELVIPNFCGGNLQSYDQTIEIIKSLGRRDMTAMIAVGKNFLGSLPVFLFGNSEQRKQTAEFLRQKKFVSLAITEHGNGSDLLSTNMTAHLAGGKWTLSGEKWLINNIEVCAQAVFLAKTKSGGGPLGFSLFAVPINNSSGLRFGQKIKTHGVRGMRMNSVQLRDHQVSEQTLLGRPSDGFQQTLKLFQVSRALAASLVLGGVETSLRLVTEFAIRRHLYGQTLNQLPVVQERLARNYVQYLTMEIIGRFAARAIALLPSELSLLSAFAKYYVPVKAEKIVEELSVTLGARSYLRDTWYEGIFQKIRRDISLVSLFDGSSQINLYILANQSLQINGTQDFDADAADLITRCFSDMALDQAFYVEKLQLTNRGQLSLLGSLSEILSEAPKEISGPGRRLQKFVESWREQVQTKSSVVQFRSAEKLCSILALICLFWNQWKGTALNPAVFEAACETIFQDLGESNIDFVCAPDVFSELETKVRNDQNLGLQNYSVGPWFQAKKEIDFAS